eukprot:TRINITY_DN20148_c0_g1_i1.p1 TRINITY_DN20148_c0_g1~~TRINITY_DN20148_c0_g1_i1.p1  ORF type:complete len:148 (+),score=45.08 TRINITY_DN20148_c0_g1_i1:117-560(+)
MSGAFDILGLSDDELSYVLQYLSLQDKKNIREVCKWLSERLIHLEPKLIHFKIKIWDKEDQKHFETAKEKGITNLAGFKVHFDDLEPDTMDYYEEVKFAASDDLVTYLTPWMDKIYGLDVFATPKLLSQYLPNLESVHSVSKIDIIT